MTARIDDDCRWWRAGGDTSVHDRVSRSIARIHGDQAERYDQFLFDACLYDDMPVEGITPSTYAIRRVRNPKRVSMNVIKSCINTVRSEVIQSRPRPFFQTTSGTWAERRRAQRTTRFLEGQLLEVGVDGLNSDAARDALVFGTSAVKVLERNGRVAAERTPTWELAVDDSDAYYGTPRTLYQVKYIDRTVLAELFSKHASDIATCRNGDPGAPGGRRGDADMVRTVEAWHLPSYQGASDGKHVICIDNATLLEEEWESDSFPFAFLRWEKPVQGFFGMSLTQQLSGIQLEINELSRTIQAAQRMFANAPTYTPREAKIAKGKLSNELGVIVEYSGPRAPHRDPAPILPAELYREREQLKQAAYDIPGVSSMAARSEKPAGLNSGKALRAYNDMQSRRLIDFSRAFEAFVVELSTQMVRLMQRLAARDAAYDVVYQGRGRTERIDWNDVALDDGSFVLQCYPVGALPNTPAGRFAALQEMVNSGFAQQIGLQPATIAKLLELPDISAEMDRLTAPMDAVEWAIEEMLDTGEPHEPDELFDFRLCVLQGGLAYHQAIVQGAPEDRLQLLRDWIADYQELLGRAQSAQQSAQAPAPGGAPVPPQDPNAAPPMAA